MLVTAAVVTPEDIPVQLRAVGHVEATRSASVRPQITGQVLRLGFSEGAEVQQGQLLVEIDPRPATAALHQAQAALARDTAQARASAEELARFAPLAEQSLVSPDQLSRLQAAADSAEATVQISQAAVERGTGADARSLGLAVVGGLLVSQLLTLYITPVVYTWLDKAGAWVLCRARRAAEVAP